MRKYILYTDENEKPVCLKLNGVLPDKELKDAEFLQLIDRIDNLDLDICDIKVREVPMEKYKRTQKDLSFISPDKKFNITIIDAKRTINAINEFRNSNSKINIEGIAKQFSNTVPTTSRVIAATTFVVILLLKVCNMSLDEEFINTNKNKFTKHAKANVESLIQDDENSLTTVNVDAIGTTSHDKAIEAILTKNVYQEDELIDNPDDKKMDGPSPDPEPDDKEPEEPTISDTIEPTEEQEIIDEQKVVDSYMAGITTNTEIQGKVDTGIIANLKQHEEIIKKVSEKRGISIGLLNDIISQESSGGDEKKYGKNIVQFEWRFWANPELVYNIYNCLTGTYDKVAFTNQKERFANRPDVTVITQADLGNEYTKVALAAIVLQIYGNKYYPNMLWTIQAYNNGETNVDVWLKEIAQEKGITVQDVLHLDNNTSLNLIREKAIKDENGLTYVEEVLKHLNPEQAIDGINDEYIIVLGEDRLMKFQGQVIRDLKYIEASEGKSR